MTSFLFFLFGRNGYITFSQMTYMGAFYAEITVLPSLLFRCFGCLVSSPSASLVFVPPAQFFFFFETRAVLGEVQIR